MVNNLDLIRDMFERTLHKDVVSVVPIILNTDNFESAIATSANSHYFGDYFFNHRVYFGLEFGGTKTAASSLLWDMNGVHSLYYNLKHSFILPNEKLFVGENIQGTLDFKKDYDNQGNQNAYMSIRGSYENIMFSSLSVSEDWHSSGATLGQSVNYHGFFTGFKVLTK